MKLAFLTPGTGNYYCGVCMRDNSLARQLIALGHDVTLLPTYLPHFLDEEDASPHQPIFFGGINVYLQHKFSLFRHTPQWIDKAFDSKWLLRKAAARSGMTSSKDLGEITLSTFRGEDGPLVKEVNKVLTWFKEHGSPDVLFLSTIMLAGIGKVLKRELKIPVYGFLQGEDSFLDSLLPEYRVEAWKLLSQDVALLDGCIAPSKYFGDLMAKRLSLKPSKIKHHPNGITTEGISPSENAPSSSSLGYLARLCPLKGLDLLVDSFIELKDSGNHDNLSLKIAGGMTDEDEPFVEEQRSKLSRAGLDKHFSISPNISREEKLAFLKNLTVFSVPARYPEAFGLYVVEAMLAGAPVILPASGAFPEIIDSTKGGKLYDPSIAGKLTETLDDMLSDPQGARDIGIQGHEAVLEQYANEKLAKRLVDNVASPTPVTQE
ncbi:MAG: glycosyltransferase family 4 protein [Verrucomicrobiota bacterium]|nr:glycosyltransferase family 4 protein [Verrucomicrobiota bacterium]